MTLFPEITFPFTNPVLVFATVMALTLFAPQIMSRLRIPGVVGLIIAGAIVGPSGFNALERNDTMVLLGTIGLLYLMFTAGISIDLDRFSKLRRQSLVFGLVSFCLPQMLTVGVSLWFLGFSVPSALLLGSIIGSHTLIAYPIAVRMGLLKNTAVTMTVGGTLVTDSLSLAILAVVIASHGGDTNWTFWTSFGVIVLVYLAVVFFALPRIGYWFFHTVRNRPEVEFAFLMTVLFFSAYAAEFVGLAPIIGAFLAGLAMNRLIPEQSTMMARIRFNGDALFIPFFLISVGLLVDVNVLFESFDVWILAGVLVTLVTVGKMAAAKIIQRAYGHTPEEGWVIFGLSVPQAAATLAVTLIGYEAGLFDSSLVNAVVVMILFSCILGPWLVERYGLKVVHADERRPVTRSQAPERILIPLANPKTSNYLLDMALMMRDPRSEEAIYPLMIVSEGTKVDERLASKQEQLQYAVARAADAEIPATPLTRIDMNIASGIARAAREERATMIIIGWNGVVSRRERIFGSVLDQLLDDTHQMIFVNKIEHPLNAIKRVVLAIPPFAERGAGFLEAIHAVKLLASRVGANLEVICSTQDLEHDRKFVKSTQPEVATNFCDIEQWSQLQSAFEKVIEEHVFVVVLSARQHTAPWIPELDEIPRQLAENFPQTSFSMVYLAQNSNNADL